MENVTFNQSAPKGDSSFLHNVKEHAPPSAGAGVETQSEVHATGDSADKAAGGGRCVSSCSESSSGGDAEMPEARPELLGRVKRIVECGSIREVNDLLSQTPGIILVTLFSGNWDKRRIKIRYSVGLFTSEVQ